MNRKALLAIFSVGVLATAGIATMFAVTDGDLFASDEQRLDDWFVQAIASLPGAESGQGTADNAEHQSDTMQNPVQDPGFEGIVLHGTGAGAWEFDEDGDGQVLGGKGIINNRESLKQPFPHANDSESGVNGVLYWGLDSLSIDIDAWEKTQGNFNTRHITFSLVGERLGGDSVRLLWSSPAGFEGRYRADLTNLGGLEINDVDAGYVPTGPDYVMPGITGSPTFEDFVNTVTLTHLSIFSYGGQATVDDVVLDGTCYGQAPGQCSHFDTRSTAQEGFPQNPVDTPLQDLFNEMDDPDMYSHDGYSTLVLPVAVGEDVNGDAMVRFWVGLVRHTPSGPVLLNLVDQGTATDPASEAAITNARLQFAFAQPGDLNPPDPPGGYDSFEGQAVGFRDAGEGNLGSQFSLLLGEHAAFAGLGDTQGMAFDVSVPGTLSSRPIDQLLNELIVATTITLEGYMGEDDIISNYYDFNPEHAPFHDADGPDAPRADPKIFGFCNVEKELAPWMANSDTLDVVPVACFNSVILAALADPDADDDGIQDGIDNCPITWNPDQTDTDENGIGDACVPDPDVSKTQTWYLHERVDNELIDPDLPNNACVVQTGGPGAFESFEFLNNTNEFPYTDPEPQGDGNSDFVGGITGTHPVVDFLDVLESCAHLPLASLSPLFGEETHDYTALPGHPVHAYGDGAQVTGDIFASFLLFDPLVLNLPDGEIAFDVVLTADGDEVGRQTVQAPSEHLLFGHFDDMIGDSNDRVEWNRFPVDFNTDAPILPGQELGLQLVMGNGALATGVAHFIGYNGDHASYFQIEPAELTANIPGVILIPEGSTQTYTADIHGGVLPYDCSWSITGPGTPSLSAAGCSVTVDFSGQPVGTYTLELIVYDECGEMATASKTIGHGQSGVSGTKRMDDDRDRVNTTDDPVAAGWTIYHDANNNGDLDAGEPSTITNANGDYMLLGLPFGDDLVIREVLQVGTNQTLPGSNEGIEDQQMYGWAYNVTLTSDEPQAFFLDFLNCETLGWDLNGNGTDDGCETYDVGHITGTKYRDNDGDGVYPAEAGEARLEGWTIYIDVNEDGDYQAASEPASVTNSNGEYSLEVPIDAARSYTIREVEQPGWSQTYPDDEHTVVVGPGAPEKHSNDFLNCELPDGPDADEECTPPPFKVEQWYLHQDLRGEAFDIFNPTNACTAAAGPSDDEPFVEAAGTPHGAAAHDANTFMDNTDEDPARDDEPSLILNLAAACMGVPLADLSDIASEVGLVTDPTFVYPDVVDRDQAYGEGAIVEGTVYISGAFGQALPFEDASITVSLWSGTTELGNTSVIGDANDPAFGLLDDAIARAQNLVIPGSAPEDGADWQPYNFEFATTGFIPADAPLSFQIRAGNEFLLSDGFFFVGYNDEHASQFTITNALVDAELEGPTATIAGGQYQYNATITGGTGLYTCTWSHDGAAGTVTIDDDDACDQTAITFHEPGEYTLTLDVIDDCGFNDAAMLTVIVDEPQGSVNGTKYYDADGDGIFSSGDVPFAGVTIYADLNGNDTHDSDEPFAITNETGGYELAGLPLDTTVAIREQVPQGFDLVDPASGEHLVTPTLETPAFEELDFLNARDPTQKEYWYLHDTECQPLNSAVQRDVLTDLTLDVQTLPMDNTDSEGDIEPCYRAPVWEALGDVDHVYQGGPSAGHAEGSIADGRLYASFLLGDPGVGELGEPGQTVQPVFDVDATVTLYADGTELASQTVTRTVAGPDAFSTWHAFDWKMEDLPAIPFGAELSLHVSLETLQGGLVYTIGYEGDHASYFRFCPEGTAEIRGEKWEDTDGNAARNGEESGLNGIEIGLYNADGELIATTVTATENGLDGQFIFSSLQPGTYTVNETAHEDYTQTFPVDDNGHEYMLTDGQTVTDAIFGNQPKAQGEIHGHKFRDANGNGIWDAGEAGLNSWEINLTDAETGDFIASTTTFTKDGQDGYYNFTELVPGTYWVNETQKDGWTQNLPANDEGYEVTLAQSDVVTGKDFGNEPEVTGSISGTKSLDDGTPLAGVTIFLDGGNNAYDGDEPSAVTGADGAYSFDNLAAGEYFVLEVQPDHLQQTAPGSTGASVNGGTAPAYGYGIVIEPDFPTATEINFVNEPIADQKEYWYLHDTECPTATSLIGHEGTDLDVESTVDDTLQPHVNDGYNKHMDWYDTEGDHEPCMRAPLSALSETGVVGAPDHVYHASQSSIGHAENSIADGTIYMTFAVGDTDPIPLGSEATIAVAIYEGEGLIGETTVTKTLPAAPDLFTTWTAFDFKIEELAEVSVGAQLRMEITVVDLTPGLLYAVGYEGEHASFFRFCPEEEDSTGTVVGAKVAQGATSEDIFTFWVDTDGDAEHSSEEPQATVGGSGPFTITDVPAGDWIVYELPAAGWTQVQPSTGGVPVTVVAGETATLDTDFINDPVQIEEGPKEIWYLHQRSSDLMTAIEEQGGACLSTFDPISTKDEFMDRYDEAVTGPDGDREPGFLLSALASCMGIPVSDLPLSEIGGAPTHSYDNANGFTARQGYAPGSVVDGTIYTSFLLPPGTVPTGEDISFTVSLYAGETQVGTGTATLAVGQVAFGYTDDQEAVQWNEVTFHFELTEIINEGSDLRFVIDMNLMDTLPAGSLHFIGYNGNHASFFRLCPAVAGEKLLDDDGDLAEPYVPHANVTIWVDANDDGVFDEDEDLYNVTGDDGSYAIVLPGTGTYTVREIPPEGTMPYIPASGQHTITIGPGEGPNADVDFLNTLVPDILTGFKCNDDNGDGECVNLRPNLAVVIDVSGSTEDAFPAGEDGNAVGDVNGDGISGTVLDAELQAVLHVAGLMETRYPNGWSISVVVFGDAAQQVDFDSGDAVRLRTDSIGELTDTFTTIRHCMVGCGTNFADAFEKAHDTLDGLVDGTSVADAYDPDNSNVIFFSDGLPNQGGDHTDEVDALRDRVVGLRAFGFAIQGASQAQRVQQGVVLEQIDMEKRIIDDADELDAIFTDDAILPFDVGTDAAVIFLDLDRDGQFDAGEPNTRPNAEGAWQLSIGNQPAGTYRLCEQPDAGWEQTGPTNSNGDAVCYDVTLGEPSEHIIIDGFVFTNQYVPKGQIIGSKCHDADRDGICDNANPHVIMTIDVSGSTEDVFESSTAQAGDFNDDGLDNTILDAQLASYALLAAQLDEGHGEAARVSIVIFAGDASDGFEDADRLDMSDAAGFQGTIRLGDDRLEDVVELLQSIRAGGSKDGQTDAPDCEFSEPCFVGYGTNFEAALQVALVAIDQAGTGFGNGNVLFTSDGEPNLGGEYSDEVADLQTRAQNIRAYGVGGNAKIAPLQVIDAGAMVVLDASDLEDAISAGIHSEGPMEDVVFYLDLNGDGTRNAGEPVAISDEDGVFRFTGLDVGTYILREMEDPQLLQTAPLEPDHYIVEILGPEDIVVVDIEGRPLEFSNDRLGAANLHGYKCEDVNGDGICQSSDPPLGGLTVFIDANEDGAKGSNEMSTTTRNDGTYDFEDVAPGNYRVCQIVPAGMVQTAPGGDLCHEGVDAQPDTTTHVPDFADRFLKASFHGFKCDDLDADGTCDDGEPGLNGFTVFIDLNNNGALDNDEPRTNTDANGLYQFTGMEPGDYRICQIVPEGYIQTAPGGDGCHEGIPGTRGTTTEVPDFADRVPKGDLRGEVCIDSDRSETCGASEVRQPGVGIALQGGPSRTTDADGQFEYTDVAIGSQTTCVTAPFGYEVIGASCKATDVPADGEGFVQFTIAELPRGAVTGYKCQDNNGNGVCDALLEGEAPDVVYIVDVSGSTVDLNTPFDGDEPVGDVNGDTISDSILDAELAAYIGLTQDLIDREVGDRSRIGIVIFSGQDDGSGFSGQALDMDPVTPGRQRTTAAGADLDGTGTPDVMEVLRRIVGHPSAEQLTELTGEEQTQSFGPKTNYEQGLQAALRVIEEAGLEGEELNVIFLSDGKPNRPTESTTAYADEAAEIRALDGNLRAFGVGGNAELGPLQVIDPDAEIFLKTSELLGLLTGVGEDRQDADPGLHLVRFFADYNGNGAYDLGEPFTYTRDSGRFDLEGVSVNRNAPFTRTICEEVPAGYQVTSGAACRDVVIQADQTVAMADFTNEPVGDLDLDGDGIEWRIDNCPRVSNPDQVDSDGDGIGDLCQGDYGIDSDGDGVPDVDDAFPHDRDEWLDTDGDGIGNNRDTDDDNDGLTDVQEIALGTNALLADTDGDGLSDGDEVNVHLTSPLLADTDGGGLSDWDEIQQGKDPLNKDDDVISDPTGPLWEDPFFWIGLVILVGIVSTMVMGIGRFAAAGSRA